MKTIAKFIGIAIFLCLLTFIPHCVIQYIVDARVTLGRVALEHLRIWIPIASVVAIAVAFQRR